MSGLHSTHPRAHSRGFTLLELLVAMVIMAMVMTAAFGAVRIGSRSWEAGHDRADITEEMRSVADFLRRQIGQTIPIAWQEGKDKRIAFIGQQREVRFIAPAPHASRGVGLLVYALVIETDFNQLKLRLMYKSYDPGVLDFTNVDNMQTAFEKTVESAALDYFGGTKIDDPSSWHQEWPLDAELFPQLVRLRTASIDGQDSWPELLLPVQTRLVK